MVSKPTSRGMLAGSAAGFTCSKPTSRRLSTGSASSFTVSKFFSRGLSAGVHPVLQFPNLPPRDCKPGFFKILMRHLIKSISYGFPLFAKVCPNLTGV